MVLSVIRLGFFCSSFLFSQLSGYDADIIRRHDDQIKRKKDALVSDDKELAKLEAKELKLEGKLAPPMSDIKGLVADSDYIISKKYRCTRGRTVELERQ